MWRKLRAQDKERDAGQKDHHGPDGDGLRGRGLGCMVRSGRHEQTARTTASRTHPTVKRACWAGVEGEGWDEGRRTCSVAGRVVASAVSIAAEASHGRGSFRKDPMDATVSVVPMSTKLSQTEHEHLGGDIGGWRGGAVGPDHGQVGDSGRRQRGAQAIEEIAGIGSGGMGTVPDDQPAIQDLTAEQYAHGQDRGLSVLDREGVEVNEQVPGASAPDAIAMTAAPAPKQSQTCCSGVSGLRRRSRNPAQAPKMLVRTQRRQRCRRPGRVTAPGKAGLPGSVLPITAAAPGSPRRRQRLFRSSGVCARRALMPSPA